MKTRNLYRSQSMNAAAAAALPPLPVQLGENWSEMSGSMIEMLGATPRIGRRSMALSDIDPKYVSQSGIWEASEVETSRGGSIRIQHLTNTAAGSRGSGGSITASGPGGVGGSRPKFGGQLEECAHFHYDTVELSGLKVYPREDARGGLASLEEEGGRGGDKCSYSFEVVCGSQSWQIQRTHANLYLLDEQLHRCVWDRSYTKLERVAKEADCRCSEDHVKCVDFVERYFARLNELPTSIITCGTVLGWLELDQRGRHIVNADDSAINTPAVAAACAVRKYTAQASDELSFEVGDMISVIDMPPPEESIWWRGKRGFTVGFFPRDCVQVIGDKVPSGLPIVPATRRRLSGAGNNNAGAAGSVPAVGVAATSVPPAKPVLRKHPKLIAFFRSFILNRPSRRRLKQSGILRERVFSCDLAEHLLATGNDVPAVLKCCAEFIEEHGIVDGIYRLSGITSNIQKLRNAFDEDKVPNLETDEAILQDIHAVSSLLKMYFRELPNPLCTYQLYEKFVAAAQATDADRLVKMREVVHELPPPHYRTLEYLSKHLARVACRSEDTGMTPKNMAIVWAPNLIRCKELESGGVEALKGIGVQAVVTEYLVRHADLIFIDELPENVPLTTLLVNQPPRADPSANPNDRPSTLAISTPIRLMSLEEAQDKAKDENRKYIEVGGGPSSLPPKYHTVIDIPNRRCSKSKKSPIKWKQLFTRNSMRKPSKSGDSNDQSGRPVIGAPQLITPIGIGGRLRHVKSVESLVSSPTPFIPSFNSPSGIVSKLGEPANSMEKMLDSAELAPIIKQRSFRKPSPVPVPVAHVEIEFHPVPDRIADESVDSVDGECQNDDGRESRSMQQSKGHNRSLSHDSYFESGEFRSQSKVYVGDTLEEETYSQSSRLSLENTSSGFTSTDASPKKCHSSGFSADAESMASKSFTSGSTFRSPVTPPPSAASVHQDAMVYSFTSAMSTSSDDVLETSDANESLLMKSPIIRSRVKNKKRKEATSPTSSHYSSSKEDLFKNQQQIRSLQATVFPLEEEDQQSDLSFKPLVPTTSVKIEPSPVVHEFEKHSSVDESSNASTPGEVYPGTNIVYSPLVNEVIETSSYENMLVTCNPMAMQTDSVFVCPLYESGISNEDSSERQYENTNSGASQSNAGNQSPPPVPAARLERSVERPRVHYENVHPASLDESAKFKVQEPVYANDRTYENDVRMTDEENEPVSDEPAPTELCSTYSSELIYADDDVDQLHYENMGDSETYGKSMTYANIYEDIDDEPKIIGESQKFKYEEVRQRRETSDQEDVEAPYESVQYSRDKDNHVVVHHHYAEIQETNGSRQRDEVSESDEQTKSVEVKSEKVEEISQDKRLGLVENPMYSIESNVEDSNANSLEVRSEAESTIMPSKAYGRCNSAPMELRLSDQIFSFSDEPESRTPDDDDFSSKDFSTRSDSVIQRKSVEKTTAPEISRELFLKRLSEPILSTCDKSPLKNKLEPGSAAWKIADAKRLATRQQSVRELLSKFEKATVNEVANTEVDSGSTNNVVLRDNRPKSCNRNLTQSHSSSHGKPNLPRPECKPNSGGTSPVSNNTFNTKLNNNNNRRTTSGSKGKFQHHRFSVGDILMTQSVPSTEEMANVEDFSAMVRSDTFPELRTDSTKENNDDSDGNGRTPLVPEKVQQAIRVAMSSVDMNDPSTRERIEKYKEERRSFLRQNIKSDLSPPNHSTDSRESILSAKSTDRDSASSGDSVFAAVGVKLLPGPELSQAQFRSTESPRKRAFSDDFASSGGSGNQFKSIKTDVPDSRVITLHVEKEDSTDFNEEVNVREKVALWVDKKRAVSDTVMLSPVPYEFCVPMIKQVHPPAVPPKSTLKAAVSLPPEGFNKLPTSNRDGLSDLDNAKLITSKVRSLSTRSDGGGKKIKDMAAFFENKQF